MFEDDTLWQALVSIWHLRTNIWLTARVVILECQSHMRSCFQMSLARPSMCTFLSIFSHKSESVAKFRFASVLFFVSSQQRIYQYITFDDFVRILKFCFQCQLHCCFLQLIAHKCIPIWENFWKLFSTFRLLKWPFLCSKSKIKLSIIAISQIRRSL